MSAYEEYRDAHAIVQLPDRRILGVKKINSNVYGWCCSLNILIRDGHSNLQDSIIPELRKRLNMDCTALAGDIGAPVSIRAYASAKVKYAQVYRIDTPFVLFTLKEGLEARAFTVKQILDLLSHTDTRFLFDYATETVFQGLWDMQHKLVQGK
jgi:hypothetical protein